MDFEFRYTQFEKAFRQEVRCWLETNIPEEMKGSPYRQDVNEEQYIFWRGMHMQLAKKRWLYPAYPNEYGGGGLSEKHETILLEELGRANAINSFTNSFIFPTLLVWATEEQKRKFLVPLLKAEKTALQAFSEPGAGSDLASLQTRAIRQGSDWIINGQKTFVTGRGRPDYFFGPIVTDPTAPRHRNLGYFLIPYPSPGMELTNLKLLDDGESFLIFMQDVRVPGDHLIGGDHEGWQVARTTLEIEHGGGGLAYLKDHALDELISYVKETSRSDVRLGNDPIIQQLVGEAYIDSHIDALFARRNYWMYQGRHDMSYEGSQSELFRKVFRMKNAERVRDVMGMYSMLATGEKLAPFRGQPEIYQRYSLSWSHPGGTPEIQKVIMSRRIGISRTKERAAVTPSTVRI